MKTVETGSSSHQLAMLTFSSANSLVMCLIKTCTSSLTLASLPINKQIQYMQSARVQ